LARGEAEKAAQRFQQAADCFGEAVALYEGQIEDEADTSRLLQAKFNQANSC